jgi:Plasmid pRiA4b ORF-3-like protein
MRRWNSASQLAKSLRVARTWLSIRVDLVSGRGEYFWPRPGRVFAAARSHTFSQLADAIDTAFARRDRSHLHKFELPDGRVIGQPEFDDFDLEFLDGEATKLSTLSLSGQFVYEFDFGDSWTHLCEVGTERIDPESELGIVPRSPFPYWGWGSIPDQYGRRWSDENGESTEPPDPGLSDLPPLRPGWGLPR